MPNLIGQTLAGRYQVKQFIGQGGMAEVYKVWDQERATYLALKLLREELAHDVIFLRRFRREANTLARLQHPHIIRFYGLEQDKFLAFMLMDYVEGENLKKNIFRNQGQGFSLRKTVNIIRPICSALGYAHRLGLVHCDLKPGNIMINKHGEVLLADFGIARMTGASTATMVGIGTPAYMAPEQVRGLDPIPQIDIYALGVVLFEMLTGGERPFTGERAKITGTTNVKVQWEQVNLIPPSPREYNPKILPGLESIVLTCLAKNPQDRYQTPLDIYNALKLVINREVTATKLSRYKSKTSGQTVLSPSPSSSQSSSASTTLHAVHSQANNIAAPTWWRHWGTWASVAGIIALILVFIFGNRLAYEWTTPEVVAETIIFEKEVSIEVTPKPTYITLPTATPQPTETPTPELGIGSTQISPVDGMIMVYVPAGEFEMGINADDGLATCQEVRRSFSDNECERSWFEVEEPVRTMYLDAFYIDQTEVTNAQYRKCVTDGDCELPKKTSSHTQDEHYGNPKYDDYPVTNVNWHDAQAYCEWARRHLPTEAEWEKAARGKNGFVYPWGNNFNGYLLNFCDENCNSVWSNPHYNDGYAHISPAGSYPAGASPYGALDMAGNVWEWVADWYDVYLGGNPNADDAFGEEFRVLRGGSWDDDGLIIRSTTRYWDHPDHQYNNYGFRCAHSATTP